MHQLTAVYATRSTYNVCMCVRAQTHSKTHAREKEREREILLFVFAYRARIQIGTRTHRMGGWRAAVKGRHFRCGERRKILSNSKNRVWIMIKRNERRRDTRATTGFSEERQRSPSGIFTYGTEHLCSFFLFPRYYLANTRLLLVTSSSKCSVRDRTHARLWNAPKSER